MLSIPLLPPHPAPCWEGVSSQRGWQTPAQRRQELSSDIISAKYSLKVKTKCKGVPELSSPSWWENPLLISASLFQALQTKPDFSFPSPCPDSPQRCSHPDTRIRTGTRLAARPQESIPGGCCWSPRLFPRLPSRERMLPPAHRQGSAGEKSAHSLTPSAASAPGPARPAAASRPCPAVYISPCRAAGSGQEPGWAQLRSLARWDL